MNKGSHESSHENHGTPIYIIMSVLFALVVFAVEGLKESLHRGGDSGFRMTTLAFVAVGLTLCFFWRRMHDGPIKTLAALIYTIGLWLYLFSVLGTSLLLHGPAAVSKLALFHQLGVGAVLLSSLVLIVALLNETKMVASLLLVGLAGLATTASSILSLVQSPNKKGGNHHEAELSSHAGDHHGEEELTADSHGHSEEHSNDHANNDANDHGNDHEAEEASSHEEEHDSPPAKKSKNTKGSHASKMKLSAKQLDEASEDETDHGNEEEAVEKPVEKDKPKAKKSPSKQAAKHDVHWSYEDDKTGPMYWGQLKNEFALCETGAQQSPIDIPSDWKARNLVKVNYKESGFDVIDNGHTIQYNIASGNYATIGNKTYQLKQIHFHTPSEHLVKGRSAILEAHFVHANDKGELAVLGSMIKAGKTHREYLKLWEYMPVKAGVNVKPKGVTFNPRALLPDSSDPNKTYAVYNYPGSLTTPPCSEKVNWNVLVESVTMSQEQIQQFRRKYDNNARPVQDLGER